MIENAHIRAERAHNEAEYIAGINEDYEASPVNPLPAWFSKPYLHMTARERGFIFGRELHLQELREEQGK